MSTSLVIHSWSRFWFADKPMLLLTIMRVAFGFFLISYFWNLQPILEMLFGTEGLVALGGSFPYQSSPVPTLFSVLSDKSDGIVWLVTFLGMFAGTLLAVGIFNRFVPILVWICVHSVVSTVPGNSGDILVQCYATLMVFAGLAGHLGKPLWQLPSGNNPAWSLRLFQIQIVFVYFFSGWHKLAYAVWHNGSAFHYVTAQEYWSRFDLTWLASYPVATSALTTFVLFFEILLFPVLVWVPGARRLILFLGFVFHTTVFVLLKVFVFHQITVLFYLAFLTPKDIVQLRNFISFFTKRESPEDIQNRAMSSEIVT